MLKDAFEHHVWATGKLLDACGVLTDEQLDTPVEAIYGSVLDTLRHLVDADAWYLWGLSAGKVGRDLDASGLSLAALQAAAQQNAEDWRTLLAEDLDPDRMVAVQRHDGTERHATVGIRLTQAAHHGTDHRSQVCTALTHLGVEPPDIDVWSYGLVSGRAIFDDEP